MIDLDTDLRKLFLQDPNLGVVDTPKGAYMLTAPPMGLSNEDPWVEFVNQKRTFLHKTKYQDKNVALGHLLGQALDRRWLKARPDPDLYVRLSDLMYAADVGNFDAQRPWALAVSRAAVDLLPPEDFSDGFFLLPDLREFKGPVVIAIGFPEYWGMVADTEDGLGGIIHNLNGIWGVRLDATASSPNQLSEGDRARGRTELRNLRRNLSFPAEGRYYKTRVLLSDQLNEGAVREELTRWETWEKDHV